MTASWVKVAFALGITGAFCTLAPSCAENNESIFIRQIQALQAPECIVTSDPTALVSFNGVLDLGLTLGYSVKPLVGNQLIARGDPRQSKAEPNRVVLTGAEITLMSAGGETLSLGGIANPYTVLASGTVDPTTSADPAYGVTNVDLIPPAVGNELRRRLQPGGVLTIQAQIRILGRTLGNVDVETGPYVYPVTLCLGCSVRVPSDARDPKGPPRNCDIPFVGGGAAQQQTICAVGQDGITDCRLCSGFLPFCTPCSSNDQCAGMIGWLDNTKPSVCGATGFCQ